VAQYIGTKREGGIKDKVFIVQNPFPLEIQCYRGAISIEMRKLLIEPLKEVRVYFSLLFSMLFLKGLYLSRLPLNQTDTFLIGFEFHSIFCFES
jgi:hypothetical protein